MEIILGAIAIAVLFFMYKTLKEYLSNPKAHGTLRKHNSEIEYENYNDPYKGLDSQEKQICYSEYGIIIALLAKVARSDERVCELEMHLIDELINDITKEFDDKKYTEQVLYKHFEKEQHSLENLESLALEFVRLTKGEYKKRLKVIEFLLMIAYADYKLDDREREIILDVAAYFELSNEDFNHIYDEFKNASHKQNMLTHEDSLHIFGLTEHEEITEEKLKDIYRKLVKENHPDIIQGRGASQQDILKANEKLVQINEAYEILKKSITS